MQSSLANLTTVNSEKTIEIQELVDVCTFSVFVGDITTVHFPSRDPLFSTPVSIALAMVSLLMADNFDWVSNTL